MFFVCSHHKNVARSSSQRGHFCFQGFQVKRVQDFYEVRDQVGAVLAAQRGLEDQPPIAAVVPAGREHRDLVSFRRNRLQLRYLRRLLLQLLHSLHNLRQKRSLVRLKNQKSQITIILHVGKSKLTFPNSMGFLLKHGMDKKNLMQVTLWIL